MTQIAVADPVALGREIRNARRALGVTQPILALGAGVGVRFIVELENGKPTAQIGKIMQVLATLGIGMTLNLPADARAGAERDGS
ncbi:MAG: transcriptional regulator [Rhodopseudomonas sp.]|nr:transcriptional regulator [Rhodopseudomonas sp.]